MYISKRIIFIIAIISFGLLAWYSFDRAKLKNEYVERLNEIEDKHINQFYLSNIKGTVSYIKKYEENPLKYVVSVKDSTGNEQTIGKVAISNFEDVKEGDVIEKMPESFELHIASSNGKSVSVVKYE